MSVTLTQIEQDTARRCGPYYALVVASAGTSYVIVNSIVSQVETNPYTNMYLLRRAAPTADDRVRRVKHYEPLTGKLTVDRVWTDTPLNGEAIELHHLHPQDELRYAVQRGLSRCYTMDRTAVTLTGAAGERALAVALPWVTHPDDIYDVQTTYVGSTVPATALRDFNTFVQDGVVYLGAIPDPWPNSLLVTSVRSVASKVNGVYSATGPTLDSDVLDVDLAYATAAAHIEAWRAFPAKLQPAAEGGFQASRKDAAAELTRLRFIPPEKRATLRFSSAVGSDRIN